MDIKAATLTGELDGAGAGGVQQALLFDAWIAVQMFLKLETVPDTTPDIRVLKLGRF